MHLRFYECVCNVIQNLTGVRSRKDAQRDDGIMATE